MGEVFVAYDRKLDRKVALKVLRHEGAAHEARLAREAQAMAQLSHPNVVAVFDTGATRGRLFLTMELIDGETLKTWQRRSGRGWRDVLRAYCEAGRGLAAAHAVGLVHRDFKPANVLVSDTQGVKVTDFGIVRTTREPGGLSVGGPPAMTARAPTSNATLDVSITQTGAVLGTPGYMAPEQIVGTDVDARTDQFAFCVSLFEGLYGYRPFAGDDFAELSNATLKGLMRPVPKGTKVPARVHRVVLRGLASAPEARYPSMQALLAELRGDETPSNRRVLVAIAAWAAIGLVALWTQRAAMARPPQLCAAAQAEAEEVWGPPEQANVERALLDTRAPHAGDTWQRTRRTLDAYVQQWITMHRQTCAATRIDGHQPEEVMTVRMACLEQRRDEVRALVQVLSWRTATLPIVPDASVDAETS